MLGAWIQQLERRRHNTLVLARAAARQSRRALAAAFDAWAEAPALRRLDQQLIAAEAAKVLRGHALHVAASLPGPLPHQADEAHMATD